MTTRRRWRAGLIALVAAIAVGGVAFVSGRPDAAPAAGEPSATTAKVEAGPLSASVLLGGTLTHRARPDGSPYVAINQAHGTYTRLPEVGAEVACGGELYRVDERPVLLLCGTVPAYRDLHRGDGGEDVRQLNSNLRALGDDTGAGAAIGPDESGFTERTEQALRVFQSDTGMSVTGALARDGAVFLPEAVRIAKVVGGLGAAAEPGTPVLEATSGSLEVQVALEGSQQGAVRLGARARIILPSNTSVTGTVDRIGTVAQAPVGPDAAAGPVTIPAAVALDDLAAVRGLDRAPVRVEIATQGVEHALSVPVTAVVGRSGGGFAVEAVRDGGNRELVAVKVCLFDATAGRVQVEGDLDEGDDVVVPSP